MSAIVTSVSRSTVHSFSKDCVPEITLRAGLGAEGDVHAGATVRHRYRVRQDPTAPNLCQIHLLQEELFAELALQRIDIAPGAMGENITTRGLDLLGLPQDTLLYLGETAVVRVTGLRDPCNQMNALHPRLMKACFGRSVDGLVVRKSGIMSVVVNDGIVRAGDAIRIRLPEGELLPLCPV